MDIRIVTEKDAASFRYIAEECYRVFKELGNKVDVQDWSVATVDDAPQNVLFIGYAYWGTITFCQRWLGRSKVVFYSTNEGIPIFDAYTRKIALDTAIVAPSKFCEGMFKAAEIEVKGVVHHGVNMEAKSDDAYTEALDKYIGKRRVLLCVASNDIRKGLDKLLVAYKLVQREIGDTFLILHSSHKKLISGSGMRGHFDLDNMISTLQLDNVWVTDMGGAFTSAQMQSLYKKAYVYCMSSLSEGFGLPALEAKRWDVPTVAIEALPFAEYIKNMDTGILIPTKKVWWYDYPERYSPRMKFHMKEYSVDEYADALLKLLKSEKLREMLSKKIDKTKSAWDSSSLYPKLLEYF